MASQSNLKDYEDLLSSLFGKLEGMQCNDNSNSLSRQQEALLRETELYLSSLKQLGVESKLAQKCENLVNEHKAALKKRLTEELEQGWSV